MRLVPLDLGPPGVLGIVGTQVGRPSTGTMKTAFKVAGAFVVAFLAGIAALQTQRWWSQRQEPNSLTGLDGIRLATPASMAEQGTVPDFRAAAKKVMPSVVSIDTLGERTNWFNESVIVPLGAGSGVIISSDGYIATNNHVIEGATLVRVHLTSGETYEAKIVGRDARTDLAVLKVDAKNLVPIELGSSSTLQVGEWVLAVGNPLGYENTVSVGVVSSLGRNLQTAQGPMLVNLIQTDAAINQGNSGGALTNAKGQLVGINSAIASNTGGGSIGIGFAIPVDNVKRVVNDILKLGYARHGMIGVDTYSRPGLLASSEVRRQIAQAIGAEPPSRGLIVRSVSRGGPAARAGIGQFDILLEIDGTPLDEPVSLVRMLADKLPGDKVRVKYWHAGETKTVTLVLEDLAKLEPSS